MRLVWRFIKAFTVTRSRVQLARWVCAMVLFAMLMMDFMNIARSWTTYPGGVVGWLTPLHPAGLKPGAADVPVCTLSIVEDGETIHVLTDYNDWDRLRYSTDAVITCLDRRRERGPWAPVHRERTVVVAGRVTAPGRGPMPQRYRDAVLVFVNEADPMMWRDDSSFNTMSVAEVGRAIETGGWKETRVLWWGVAHNVAVAAGVTALVWLIVLEVRATWTVVCRDDRRARGLCGFCGYDQRGAGEGVACPECGRDAAGRLARGG